MMIRQNYTILDYHLEKQTAPDLPNDLFIQENLIRARPKTYKVYYVHIKNAHNVISHHVRFNI